MNKSLDMRVAKEILGWTLHTTPKNRIGKRFEFLAESELHVRNYFNSKLMWKEGYVPNYELVPAFTTDMNHAIKAVRACGLDIPAFQLPQDPAQVINLCLAFQMKRDGGSDTVIGITNEQNEEE